MSNKGTYKQGFGSLFKTHNILSVSFSGGYTTHSEICCVLGCHGDTPALSPA